MKKNLLLEQALGLQISSLAPVSGGDINKAYRLETSEGVFFLKLNDAERFPYMFAKEARGLEGLQKFSEFRTPRVVQYGSFQNQQFLLLEHIMTGRPNPDFWENFAAKLAGMHRATQEKFGWLENNFIGNLVQENPATNTWKEFFSRSRILPLAKMLLNKDDFSKTDFKNAENLCARTDEFFPSEPPAFVHGDLWSGNFMCDENGNPVLIDPAVSFSHREMDIGLSLLFGGYPKVFYDTYNEIYPLEPDFKERLPVAQLYPLLMHAVVFGGSYVQRCREIIAGFA